MCCQCSSILEAFLNHVIYPPQVMARSWRPFFTCSAIGRLTAIVAQSFIKFITTLMEFKQQRRLHHFQSHSQVPFGLVMLYSKDSQELSHYCILLPGGHSEDLIYRTFLPYQIQLDSFQSWPPLNWFKLTTRQHTALTSCCCYLGIRRSRGDPIALSYRY
jgi:hypothetical protein